MPAGDIPPYGRNPTFSKTIGAYDKRLRALERHTTGSLTLSETPASPGLGLHTGDTLMLDDDTSTRGEITLTVLDNATLEFYADVVIAHSTTRTTSLYILLDGVNPFGSGTTNPFLTKTTTGTHRMRTTPNDPTGTSSSSIPGGFIVLDTNLEAGDHTVEVFSTAPGSGTAYITDQNYVFRAS